MEAKKTVSKFKQSKHEAEIKTAFGEVFRRLNQTNIYIQDTCVFMGPPLRFIYLNWQDAEKTHWLQTA